MYEDAIHGARNILKTHAHAQNKYFMSGSWLASFMVTSVCLTTALVDLIISALYLITVLRMVHAVTILRETRIHVLVKA